MKKEHRPKDIVIRNSYRDGYGRIRAKVKPDLNDEENMLDRKHQIPNCKFYEMWGGYGCVNYKYITRFFHANVGRPWSEVSSKLMKKVDSRTWAGREWRRAIEGELIHPTPCKIGEDGHLYTLDNHLVSKYNWYRTEYYIDENHILRETQKKPKEKQAVYVNGFGPVVNWDEYKKNSIFRSRKVGRDSFLIRIDGVWFVVETKDLSFLEGNPNKESLLITLSAGVDRDVVLYDTAFRSEYKEKIHTYRWELLLKQTYCGELRVGISKQSASGKLLNKYGLVNDAQIRPEETCDTATPNKSSTKQSLMHLFE